MLDMRWLTTVVLLGAFASAEAQESKTPQGPDFRPLEFLVGSCWIGTFPDGKVTDEHCFEWVYDKKFIRDRHVARGGAPYQGETIYGWDPATKRLSYTYWNSAGITIVGQVNATPEGVVFPSRYATANGDVEIEAVWTRVGNDAYRVVQRQRVDTGWKTIMTMQLSRKP
jgi:hypothetical protein